MAAAWKLLLDDKVMGLLPQQQDLILHLCRAASPEATYCFTCNMANARSTCNMANGGSSCNMAEARCTCNMHMFHYKAYTQVIVSVSQLDRAYMILSCCCHTHM